jgi:ribosomal protein S18 acetylase RimI-like enzyme
MKDIIKKLLRESLGDTLTYEEEYLGSVYGQDNYELSLYLNGEIVGLVNYVIFEGGLTVSMINVRPEFRRKGFGSRMMQYVKKIHPEAKYKPSFKTDLGMSFKHKEVPDLNKLDEGLGKEIGYKVMRYENGMLIAGANSKLKFKAEIGKTISMPGNGIYMSPNKEYVLNYYSGLADSEVLITFEFNTNDITFGNLTDKESEVAVKQAKIINLEPIEG